MPRGRKQSKQSAHDLHPAARQPTMREQAYRYIQKLIAAGTLKGGAAVSELVLAKELGSSRTPIREAMGQLVAEGLLEQTPTGTILVVQLNRQDVIELYELREALEIYSIEKVAKLPMDPVDRERLQRTVDDVLALRNELETSGKAALNAEQMNRFLASDLAFHSMLMNLANNSRIQKVLIDMRLLIRIFAISRRGHQAGLLTKIHEHHQHILAAVQEGKSQAARELLSEHIRTSLRERLEEFDRWRREQYLLENLPSFASEQELMPEGH